MATRITPKETNPLIRVALMAAGWLAVLTGVIGVVLPVLPTTPFLILAASCFAKSSRRFHQWLLSNRLVGPIITDWQSERRVKTETKRWAMVTVVLTFSVSIYVVPLIAVKVLLLGGMLICLLGIYRAPGGNPFKRARR